MDSEECSSYFKVELMPDDGHAKKHKINGASLEYFKALLAKP